MHNTAMVKETGRQIDKLKDRQNTRDRHGKGQIFKKRHSKKLSV